MSKFDIHSQQSQSRNIDFARGAGGFGSGVTTDITAVKKQTKREKLEADAIPMGKIGYKVETTQDRQDVESVETDEQDYPAKANSTDQINDSAVWLSGTNKLLFSGDLDKFNLFFLNVSI